MTVRQSLLAILDQGPCYGHQLRAEFERRTGATWPLNVGQIYNTLERLEREGCSRFVVTDVNQDGTLAGPNLELLKQVCAVTTSPVIASGGVSTLQDLIDIAALTPLGVEGAIVGKALYAGRFTLPEALDAVSR